jgi:hypothetical protein
MKKLILLAGFCLPFLASYGQPDFCNVKNTSFQAGEKLMFRVYYNMGPVWINAGNAIFSIQPASMHGRKTHHITGFGKTAKAYEWVFKVRDQYETFLDKETMLPVRFIRDVSEGGIAFKHDVAFNHKKGEAISDKKTYEIPSCTQDVLSAIYFARNIDYSKFKAGDKIPFNMFLDDKVYSLYIKYLGKEKVKTKLGTFNSIKIAPLLIEGTIFKGGEKMAVWVSDDANHLPLRVESPILVGSIKVDLVAYDSIRNDFSSAIKLKRPYEIED